MRGFRDRDFIQTLEGFFFCVVGPVHPINRVISYIKYIPSQSGVWGKGENHFNRILKNYTISNLLETFEYLEKNHPHYLFKSEVDNITVTAVPHECIKKHFMPEQKLSQLRDASDIDFLQQKLLRFTTFLEKISGISEISFGITGSILLDIHQPKFSDLDVIVYGTKDSWALKKALTQNQGPDLQMKRLQGKALDDWCLKKSQQYPITKAEAFKLYSRKWNLGFFEDRWVSIHPVKTEKEVTEKYGANIYRPHGQVTFEAIVYDNVDSLFLPAVYRIKDVKFLDVDPLVNVSEVITYEGLYSSLAENGEKIQVKGKLEEVTEKQTNKQHFRVVVGSPEGKGKEFIKIME